MAKSETESVEIQERMDQYKIAEEGWRHIHDEALDDLRFVYNVDGGQWPDEISKERQGRPQLTINKLLKFIRQLRGDSRQNRPRINVIPVDDQADPKMAEMYNGLIRQIEYISNAEVAYDTAYMNAISGSIGHFRLLTQYEDEYSFNQEIRIKRIENPFSVLLDPSYKEFDSSDAKFGFISDVMSKKAFEKEYPGAEAVNFKDGGRGHDYSGWFEKDKIRVAEYFYKEFTKKKIALIETPPMKGTIMPQRGVMELTDKKLAMLKKQKGKVIEERETTVSKVFWEKMTGKEILDKREWPGKYIPIIPMVGDEINVNGKKFILSLIRDAKDIQRMYNYWSTAATEAVALVPKSPFIIANKQVEGYEKEWQQANIKNRPYLPYKHIPGMQKPSREQQIQIPTGLMAMLQNTSIELEDQLGRYEASKGAPSNERSGLAIQKRINQSDKGTFTFVDNESRAITYAGRQIVDLIPKVYDTQRALHVLGEDGQDQIQNVNVPTGRMKPDGTPEIKNDLTVGKFDLIATVGAGYSSRRQEMLGEMVNTMQYAPSIAPVLAPLIFKYSDWPGAQEIYKELKGFVDKMQPASPGGGAPAPPAVSPMGG